MCVWVVPTPNVIFVRTLRMHLRCARVCVGEFGWIHRYEYAIFVLRPGPNDLSSVFFRVQTGSVFRPVCPLHVSGK